MFPRKKFLEGGDGNPPASPPAQITPPVIHNKTNFEVDPATMMQLTTATANAEAIKAENIRLAKLVEETNAKLTAATSTAEAANASVAEVATFVSTSVDAKLATIVDEEKKAQIVQLLGTERTLSTLTKLDSLIALMGTAPVVPLVNPPPPSSGVPPANPPAAGVNEELAKLKTPQERMAYFAKANVTNIMNGKT